MRQIVMTMYRVEAIGSAADLDRLRVRHHMQMAVNRIKTVNNFTGSLPV